MKLNFWQWLAVVLLIIGIVIIYKRKHTAPAQPVTPPTTQMVPATQGVVAQ